MVKFLIARGYQVHSRFSYDYGHHSFNLPFPFETKGPKFPDRSTMLGDALVSFATDRLAIVKFLLEEGANTEYPRENYPLLESVFIRASICWEHEDDTVKIFEMLFQDNITVDRSPGQVLLLSLLWALMYSRAYDALISRVHAAVEDLYGLIIVYK
ncbi:hypothetical protein RRF57_009733 [Xylaria bambusicola]|uniref:Uncharacterized protein n=1 Tax=Xylaria bambusicola TaxID=326684 RepID=A0AAN7UZU1_9PEZI